MVETNTRSKEENSFSPTQIKRKRTFKVRFFANTKI